jgi:hypothetical protein
MDDVMGTSLALLRGRKTGNRIMSIWLLLIFAVCALAATLSFHPTPAHSMTVAVFAVSLIIFLVGILTRGIRRPVV